jgi:hypothetical protein
MGWNSLLVVGAVTALMATGAAAAADEQPVLLTVGPPISFEPGNIRITSRVTPSAANRALIIVVDSGSHYSSSEVRLDGEQAPRSRSMFLKNLPAGDYEVVATLRTETGVATVVRQKFQVVSGRGDTQ